MRTALDRKSAGQATVELLRRCREIGSPEIAAGAIMRASAPLILVSQHSRSGGSLFAQLVDGHPKLQVFPHEMNIGFPSKIRWPEIDPDGEADSLFACLFDPRLGAFAAKGYRKVGKVQTASRKDRLAFTYAPAQHYALFSDVLPPPPRSRRQVLDAYFAAFFGSWQRMTMTSPADYIAGFVPALASRRGSVDGFFGDYPDGRLVSIVRNPSDWVVSRRAHTKSGDVRHGDLQDELRLWNKMADAALDYVQRFAERTFLIRFEELVKRRETVMRAFTDWAGLSFDDILLRQTFDGHPINPNTNFQDPQKNLAKAAINRRRQLTWAERAKVFAATSKAQRRLAPYFRC